MARRRKTIPVNLIPYIVKTNERKDRQMNYITPVCDIVELTVGDILTSSVPGDSFPGTDLPDQEF